MIPIRRRPCALILWPILILLVGGPLPAQGGKNANGALIVHTNDAVSYTTAGDYCGVDFDDPSTCENAGTRTDKDENTPAVIWFLAAFPDTANPAVTVVYFGIDHNLPPGQGYFADWGYCGPGVSLEVPDAGWPENVTAGNSVGFGSPVVGDTLLPFYWLAAYGFEGAYLGTAINPTGGYAAVVDDSNPGVEDSVSKFGTVRWNAAGANDCPSSGGGGDGPGGDESMEMYPNAEMLPSVIYPNSGRWTFIITGVPNADILSTTLRVDSNRNSPVASFTPRPDASVWDFDYPEIGPADVVVVEVQTRESLVEFPVAVVDTLTQSFSDVVRGAVDVQLVPGTFGWTADIDHGSPSHQYRAQDQVTCHDTTLDSLLALIGVTTIVKHHAYTSDADTLWSPRVNPDRVYVVHPRARSTYSLVFPEQHSPIAIAEILRALPVVLRATRTPKVTFRTEPCDWTVRGTDYYNQQWEIQSYVEFPQKPNGIQANWGWCASEGSGTRVFLLDSGVMCAHEALNGAIDSEGDCPQQVSNEHGTIMGVIIAGRKNAGKLVGAAPCATLFPLDITQNPGGNWPGIQDALLRLLNEYAQPGIQIVNMSWDIELSPEDVALFQAYVNDLYAAEYAVFAASEFESAIPAALDHVIGVAGITASGWDEGYLKQTEGLRAPSGPLGWTAIITGGYSPVPYSGTSVACALAAGGSAILAECAGAGTVQDLYDEVMAIQGDYGRLIMGAPCGFTGIEDVSAFEAEALDREIRVTWIVEVEEGIDEITLSASPSCWGAFGETIYTFRNPIYTEDFIHYEVFWPAPYNRNYYFRLDVVGTEGTRSLNAVARPLNGYVMQRCVRLENVDLTVIENTAELSWDRCSRPPGTGALEYWVYRGQGLHLSECGPNAGEWGGWFRGSVDDYVDLCDQDVPERRCWDDDDLEIGYPYTYRVAAVGRENIGGPIIWISELADGLTGFAVGPAGASDAWQEQELMLGPNPVRTGRNQGHLSLLVPFNWSAGPVEIQIVDVAGRVVWSLAGEAHGRRMEIPLRSSDFSPGVYFVRLRGGSGERLDRRMVIIP